MGMSGGSGSDAVSDINVTPLVDVMLVLLIIFMVTAPMLNQDVGVEIDLPKSEAPPLDMSEDQLVLAVDGEQRLYLNDTEVKPEEVEAKLAAIAKANPDVPLFLRADGGVPYREVARLLGVAKKAGMPRVGMVFEPEDGEK